MGQTAPSGGTRIDDDRDTLHTLPLKYIPMANPVLKRARLVKNLHLQSLFEMFRDGQAGSGLVEIDLLPQQLGAKSLSPEDYHLVKQLAALPSYDVFSLRITLRQLGIPVEGQDALKLSPDMTANLSAYMKSFTHPLLKRIYGDESANIESFGQVVALFRDPDAQKARQRLMMMANKLGIEVIAIPQFLEDYGDIFLSLSYYQQFLDQLTPRVGDLFQSMNELRKGHATRSNMQLMNACKQAEATLTELMTAVTTRLEGFERNTKDMWASLSAERFRTMETMVKSSQRMMGGILCALTVKMDAWSTQFPTSSSGSPGRRADFILKDLSVGLKKSREFEGK